jgi:hypothetical protein
MEAFYAEKEAAKATTKAKKKASRDKRRTESTARPEKAGRKEEEKKNDAGPSTIVLSSSFEWTSTPVSETTPSSHSSDYDWDSE